MSGSQVHPRLTQRQPETAVRASTPPQSQTKGRTMPASPYWQAIEDLICRDLARCIRITQEYRPNESIRAAIYCNFYADEQYVCFPDLFMATAPVPSETGFYPTENCIGQIFEGDGSAICSGKKRFPPISGQAVTFFENCAGTGNKKGLY